jgi:DNA replication protein DnaC
MPAHVATVAFSLSKAFSAGRTSFAGYAIMASAARDRLFHCCTVVNIRGESFRLKEKRQAARSTLDALLDAGRGPPKSAPNTQRR